MELRKQEGAVVVDIRDSQAFAAGHITGARHLDNHSVAEFIRNADLDAPTLVVCYHGNSSQSAAAYLVGQGFSDVYSVDGGLNCGAPPTRPRQPKALPNKYFHFYCSPRPARACGLPDERSFVTSALLAP